MPLSKKNLAEAKANLKAQVRADITKRELLQFRCDPELMRRLVEQAASSKQPVGVMVRDWVSQRLAVEEAKATTALNPELTAVLLGTLETTAHQLRDILEQSGLVVPVKAPAKAKR